MCTDCQVLHQSELEARASDFASGYGGLTEEQIADGLQMIDGVLAEMACQTL